ncbi:hypothetical protein [Tahibacter caeni]|uniref:hypothetical protein n=1 Tax=Tahibacter caeni TaxID=1453545 RepID=UPI0021481328|nr:hypothetical protein [Tahibacter caeni]
MYSSQYPWVELYRALLDLSDSDGDAYPTLLQPWLAQQAEEARWPPAFARRTQRDWAAASSEDLCRLYAMFRVTSLLLLRFQHGRAGTSDYAGPPITAAGFLAFHEALGLQVPHTPAYHPFFHEIVAVEPEPEPEPAAPVLVLGERWPALMLGDLLYLRAGCVVAAGAQQVVKSIAEHSTLYWTFRRRDRPCRDLSHGWGSNSQWSTALRRDYRTPLAYHYNVDAKDPLPAPGTTADAELMHELLRHRGLVRTVADDSDLCPYGYTHTEPVAAGG